MEISEEDTSVYGADVSSDEDTTCENCSAPSTVFCEQCVSPLRHKHPKRCGHDIKATNPSSCKFSLVSGVYYLAIHIILLNA